MLTNRETRFPTASPGGRGLWEREWERPQSRPQRPRSFWSAPGIVEFPDCWSWGTDRLWERDWNGPGAYQTRRIVDTGDEKDKRVTRNSDVNNHISDHRLTTPSDIIRDHETFGEWERDTVSVYSSQRANCLTYPLAEFTRCLTHPYLWLNKEINIDL